MRQIHFEPILWVAFNIGQLGLTDVSLTHVRQVFPGNRPSARSVVVTAHYGMSGGLPIPLNLGSVEFPLFSLCAKYISSIGVTTGLPRIFPNPLANIFVFPQ